MTQETLKVTPLGPPWRMFQEDGLINRDQQIVTTGGPSFFFFFCTMKRYLAIIMVLLMLIGVTDNVYTDRSPPKIVSEDPAHSGDNHVWIN